MEWKSVESSQISEVGYEPESSVLGIRFKPTRKQVEAGETGSEYHYSFVDSDTHAALLTAESVGSYFIKNIKSDPVKYPYTKVS